MGPDKDTMGVFMTQIMEGAAQEFGYGRQIKRVLFLEGGKGERRFGQ